MNCIHSRLFFLGLGVSLTLSGGVLEARPGRPGSGASSGSGVSRTAPTRTGTATSVRTGGAGKAAMSETQQQNVGKLKGDGGKLKSESNVTTEQKQKLSVDLKTLAQGTVKPSQESVDSLATSLSGAMSDQTLTTQEKAKVMKDVRAVMNSANIPASELEAVIQDCQSILAASNVDQADVQLIVNDLRAIGTELKKNATAVPSGKKTRRVPR